MSNDLEKNNLEELFKNTFTNYEENEVNPEVWKNIRLGLKGAGMGVVIQTLFNKIGTSTVIAAASSVIAIITTILVMNNVNSNKKNSNNTKEVAITTAPKVSVEKVTPKEIKDFLSTNSEGIKRDSIIAVPQTHTNAAKEVTVQKEEIKRDKKKIQKVINNFSRKTVASISASPVAGTVPLIVNLKNDGYGKVNKWMFGDGSKPSATNDVVHVYENPGVYTITLTSTDINGNTAVDSIKVEVSGNSSISAIPASFSPNNDGVEDVFVFQSKNIDHMDVMLFNKSGNVIYTWKGTDGKWDGKTKDGKEAKEGIYFYIIKANGVDGKKYEQKGSIKLIR